MSTVVNDYSPVTVGDTAQPFAPVFYTDKSSTPAPFNLTGLTISMRMTFQNDPTIAHACTGTWTIDDAVNGKAHYQYQAADVATAGMWLMQVEFTNGLGQVLHSDVLPLEIDAAI